MWYIWCSFQSTYSANLVSVLQKLLDRPCFCLVWISNAHHVAVPIFLLVTLVSSNSTLVDLDRILKVFDRSSCIFQGSFFVSAETCGMSHQKADLCVLLGYLLSQLLMYSLKQWFPKSLQIPPAVSESKPQTLTLRKSLLIMPTSSLLFHFSSSSLHTESLSIIFLYFQLSHL